MITVEDVSRNYGSFVAVDRVSFEIQQGEVVGLLGHNGAGKTTIMKMLTGFLEPSGGSVLIDGDPINENRQAIQAKIGYLPESSPVYPEMPVIEYLLYVAELRGVPASEREGRVIQAIQRTRIEEKAKELVSTLSRGFKQRVGVAQAILNEPEILILDEPTNGLDPSQIQEMRQLIRDLAQHSTVIISTHILQEVSAVCNRVIIISRGRLALDSKLTDLGTQGEYFLLTNRPATEIETSLRGLDGIAAVIDQGKDESAQGLRHRVLVNAKDAPGEIAPQIAKKLIEDGVELHTIQPAAKNLETVFLEASAS